MWVFDFKAQITPANIGEEVLSSFQLLEIAAILGGGRLPWSKARIGKWNVFSLFSVC